LIKEWINQGREPESPIFFFQLLGIIWAGEMEPLQMRGDFGKERQRLENDLIDPARSLTSSDDENYGASRIKP
jgi:hypothetical protein